MTPYDLDRGSSGIINNFNRDKVDKELSPNRKVRLRHYNITEYIITEVKEVSEFEFKLEITDKMIYLNIFPGDYVSVYFINQMNEECIIGGIVDKAQASFPQSILVKTTRIEKHKNERKNRRYAINACCNLIDENNEGFGIVKNVSYSGLRLFSKAVIEDRKNLTVKLFINENLGIDISAGIVRKRQLLNYNEYGLVILPNGATDREQLNEIIRYLAEKEEKGTE